MLTSLLSLSWVDYTIISCSVVGIIGICALMIFLSFRSQNILNKLDENLKYDDMLKIKTGYLVEKEKTFYDAAFDAAKLMNAFIFPKVEVCNIIGVKDEKNKHGHVFSSCVDFCLFSKIDFAPILIIDLYDNRIGGETLGEMDMFLNRIIKTSGIPLLPVEVQDRYSVAELKEKMEATIAKNNREILQTKAQK